MLAVSILASYLEGIHVHRHLYSAEGATFSRLHSSRGTCCAGESGPKLDQCLREALLQHLLTWEAGDAARQQSARTFLLCRSFFEEVQAGHKQMYLQTPP